MALQSLGSRPNRLVISFVIYGLATNWVWKIPRWTVSIKYNLGLWLELDQTVQNTTNVSTLSNFPPGQGWRGQRGSGDLPPRVQPRIPRVRRGRPQTGEYWPVIGQYESRDLNPDLWLVNIIHVTRILSYDWSKRVIQVFGYEERAETRFTEIFYRGPSDQKLSTIGNLLNMLS